MSDAREIRTALGPKAAKQWPNVKNKIGNLITSDAGTAVFNLLTHSIIKGDKLNMKDYYLPDRKHDDPNNGTTQ